MPSTRELLVHRWRDAVWASGPDDVAVEAPLRLVVRAGEVRHDLGLTMRTPGHDAELLVGWLWSEGLLDDPADLGLVWEDGDSVIAELRGDVDPQRAARRAVTTSACGVCGADALAPTPAVGRSRGAWRAEALQGLPEALTRAQPGFHRCGGLHATGLFTADGALVLVREDVGRHNAFDKAVGALLADGPPPRPDLIAAVSGRASHELVHKAARAGLGGLVAVGAPSTAAVATAQAAGLLLVGFTRADRLNVYAGHDLLAAPSGAPGSP